MKKYHFDLGDHVIDASNIHYRFDELSSDLVCLEEDIDTANENLFSVEDDSEEYESLKESLASAEKAYDNWEDREEYDELLKFIDSVPNRGILYHEDYMVEYAENILDEQYPNLTRGGGYPYDYISIDYDGIAQDLMCDMGVVETPYGTYYYSE